MYCEFLRFSGDDFAIMMDSTLTLSCRCCLYPRTRYEVPGEWIDGAAESETQEPKVSFRMIR